MDAVINAQGVTKLYGNFAALNNIRLQIPMGRIVGLIGPNGAGKTTFLRCLMGLATHEGKLDVLGMSPLTQRMELLKHIAYIADTAVLPQWIKVDELLDYTAGVHPNFDRSRAEFFLSQTEVPLRSKIKTLSKGMITQVHLAIAISIDAKLLVLDEPTLGLDILYRKRFYEQLLNDFFDEQRTILITTHQVEEVESILSDLIFLKQGKVILNKPMEQMQAEFFELEVTAEKAPLANALQPLHSSKTLGGERMIFQTSDVDALRALGVVRSPSVADLFVALMS